MGVLRPGGGGWARCAGVSDLICGRKEPGRKWLKGMGGTVSVSQQEGHLEARGEAQDTLRRTEGT